MCNLTDPKVKTVSSASHSGTERSKRGQRSSQQWRSLMKKALRANKRFCIDVNCDCKSSKTGMLWMWLWERLTCGMGPLPQWWWGQRGVLSGGVAQWLSALCLQLWVPSQERHPSQTGPERLNVKDNGHQNCINFMVTLVHKCLATLLLKICCFIAILFWTRQQNLIHSSLAWCTW